jgi:hypothetical protein
MLHRVNPPQYAPLLMQVVEFEKNLLTWICTPPVIFTLDGVKSALGNDEQAEWLWERIEWSGKRTAFGNLVSGATDYIQKNPAAGPRILQCAQNDLDFHSHFTDVHFLFYERRFPTNEITEADLTIFKPVLVSLYEKLFDSTGFPVAIHQNATIGNLTRAMWNQNFWDSNPSIRFCPACNGQRPSVVRGAYASDVDHCFPKEKYPFLSIHPDNLIPTCLECNTKAHRDYDPLDDHNTETLLDTFHSYYCPAIEHIKLCVDSKTGPGVKVSIKERDDSNSKRINNLVRVFDLETRWADWFMIFVASTIETLRPASPLSRPALRTLLEADLDNSQRYSSTRDKCFVYASFLQYVLSNQQEFDSLCASFGI